MTTSCSLMFLFCGVEHLLVLVHLCCRFIGTIPKFPLNTHEVMHHALAHRPCISALPFLQQLGGNTIVAPVVVGQRPPALPGATPEESSSVPTLFARCRFERFAWVLSSSGKSTCLADALYDGAILACCCLQDKIKHGKVIFTYFRLALNL